MDSLTLNIAGTVDDSIVDGPGLRYTIFVQGCHHNCYGCHNPQTHDYNAGKKVSIKSLLKEIKANPLLSGVTFSGGEPFDQSDALIVLAKEIHKLDLNIWCYTGYTIEEIESDVSNEPVWISRQNLLSEVDFLVDGPFIMSQRDLSLDFRGSKNQRIIDVKKYLRERNVSDAVRR